MTHNAESHLSEPGENTAASSPAAARHQAINAAGASWIGEVRGGRVATSSPWLLAGVVLLMAGAMLGVVAAGDRAFSVELDLMIAVQRLQWPWLDTLAWASSRGGDAWPGLLLISLLAGTTCLLRGRRDLALFVLLATALRAMGPPLKWLFASPRPPAEVITVFEHADGFGYPSGHAFGAALVFGAITVALPDLFPNQRLAAAVRIVAVVVMILVALSRIRLGVHWPSDVAGGLAFGLGLLCLLRAAMLRSRPAHVRT